VFLCYKNAGYAYLNRTFANIIMVQFCVINTSVVHENHKICGIEKK